MVFDFRGYLAFSQYHNRMMWYVVVRASFCDVVSTSCVVLSRDTATIHVVFCGGFCSRR